MSLFCIPLEDQTPLFKPDFKHPHFDQRTPINLNLEQDINPYWIEILKPHDLEIIRVELFYGPNNFPYTMGIHTDRNYGDWGKINWVFGGEGCQMHWYKSLTNQTKEVMATDVHSNYNLYDASEVKLLCSDSVHTPSIVQVGIPHNITNPGHERWCYSMVIHDKRSNDNVTFGRLKRAFGK
jgi:hypothetical protein